MYDGVPVEHFHRFISTPTSTVPSNSLLIQTPPISTSTNLNFLSFDPLLFPPLQVQTHHPHSLFQPNHFVRTPTHDHYNDTEGKADQENKLGVDVNESWSNDEVIQLLRIKSSSENWYKDFTNWDHVSRKLAEMGYKRSSEKCKEKYEEETCRSFSSTTIGCNKSSSRYLISEELDEHDLCNNSDQNNHDHVPIDQSTENVNHQEQTQPQEFQEGEQNLEAPGQQGHFEKNPTEIVAQPTDQDDAQVTKSKKRKRKYKKFKMVKGLCVDLVNRMMAQQEEMHKKLLEDMANREEEKMKREEAWRKEEMERLQMEIHIREQEQEIVRDRQSTITQFLNKITSFDEKIQIPFNINLEDLQAIVTNIDKPMSLSEISKTLSSDNITKNNPYNQDQLIANDDIGKRWPREEVLALISIRSNVSNGNGGNSEEHGGRGGGGSLWERISQGMLELGYKRSAKRCKEKWENINKYFRKTKDANKKRSLESRTCPYYHELSKLYNQEIKVASFSNSTGISISSQEPLTTKEN